MKQLSWLSERATPACDQAGAELYSNTKLYNVSSFSPFPRMTTGRFLTVEYQIFFQLKLVKMSKTKEKSGNGASNVFYNS
jgi:hypothetical protein